MYSNFDALSTFSLHKHPFVRLIIPWITGVFCGDRFLGYSPGFSVGLVALILFFALSLIFYFFERYSLRWCFGVAVFSLCFTGGWMGITWQLQQTADYTFPEEETVYKVMVTDIPEAKKRSVLCQVLLLAQCDSTGIYPIGECKAMLYLPQDSAVFQLENGDELLVSTCISPPVNSKNFDEFDYARYLLRKGISGTGYVASGKWRLLSSSKTACHIDLYLRHTATFYREKVISLYRELGLNGDDLAVLSALTVGDKTELSESVRESYSIAGASHILALSGLHIGLLYALLLFILNPFIRRGGAGKWVCTVFLITLLWTFAFFTGLSPSVVRSVTMFS